LELTVAVNTFVSHPFRVTFAGLTATVIAFRVTVAVAQIGLTSAQARGLSDDALAIEAGAVYTQIGWPPGSVETTMVPLGVYPGAGAKSQLTSCGAGQAILSEVEHVTGA
jgi:hypothetical protein